MAIEGKITSLYTDKTMSEALLPRTNTKAITDDKGVNLNAILNQVAYVDTENSEAAVAPLNADTLAGQPADNYASKSYVSNEIAKAQLGGGSGEGDIDLSGFATKDDLLKIDYPVDSVNGKTGAVTLSASDIGARASTWTPTVEEVGALPESALVNVDVTEAVDFDTLINEGTYRISTSVITNCANAPYENAILLSVVNVGGNVIQIATRYGLGNPGKMKFRSLQNGSGWNPWADVYNTEHKPTPAEIGATKIVRLWKGVSGTFEAQTLSIGAFNEYSYIGIVPTFYASGDRRMPMLFLNSGGTKGGYICGLSSDGRVNRLISNVDASAGTITFGQGYKDGVVDNKAAYPYLILGFL